MKKRDSKGRFSKSINEDIIQLTLDIPSFKKIILWALIFLIIFPWLMVISKFNIFQRMETFFDGMLKEKYEENSENGKKSGLFY